MPFTFSDALRPGAAEAVEAFARAGDVRHLRVHGDCHGGNILWRDETAHFVARGFVAGRFESDIVEEQEKVLGEITKDEFPHPQGSTHGDAPGSNPLLMVAGDKLILSPEGQHGKHGFILFDAKPAKLTLYGNQEQKWVPPHASTTAYGRQPIVNPIVDGRMFFRGGNGVYCYDLRQR